MASLPAFADEGGVPFWMSGSYSSLSAVPATPGWSMPTIGYYYSGDASKSKKFVRGGDVSAGLDSRMPLVIVQPSYAPQTKFLGGQASLGLGFGYGRNTTDAHISFQKSGTRFNNSSSVSGFTDLFPIASVAWNHGVHNWMTYLTGSIPTGSYDSSRLSNIGIGHAAIDAGGAYTYFDPKTGIEFSALLGFTYNWKNSDTNYKNGIDSHLDWGASRFLSEKWEVGLAGYVYNQVTGDSGSGAKLGAFKSRVAAIGPQIGYAFEIGGKPAYANLRAYKEFWAKNRIEGYALYATVVIPLGK
ncbi:phenol degradation protein [Pusillimonas sp. ANT_WB101]|nr:phenol degradation protein [Pusillimonas sp. ANT_WB101]